MQRFHLKITRLALEQAKAEHNGAAFASRFARWFKADLQQVGRFGRDEQPRWISGRRAAINSPSSRCFASKILLAGQGV